jgi:hypothetical protein
MSVLNAFWPFDRLALLWAGAMLTDLRVVLVMGWFSPLLREATQGTF